MLSTPDIKAAEIDYSSASRITRQRYEESPEIMLTEGDVLLTKDGSTIGTVNVVRQLPEPATVNGSIAVLTPSAVVDGRFLYWYIASQHAQSLFDRLRGGMGVPHLFQRDINRIIYPAPPLSEQRAIADYLDRETAQIDILIEEQQKLVQLSEARRSALISTTIGLDFNPLLWDRQRPSTRVGHHYSVTLGKMLDAGRAIREGDVVLPYVRAGNIQDGGLDLSDVKSMPFSSTEAATLDIRRNDILVVEGGAIGTSVVVDSDMPGWSFQKTVNRVRPTGDWSSEWLAYVFRTYRDNGVFDILCNRSTIPHLTAEKLRTVRIPIVAPWQQREAVALLHLETARIDQLIKEAERLSALAKERRAALITAAVTGQIDVGATV